MKKKVVGSAQKLRVGRGALNTANFFFWPYLDQFRHQNLQIIKLVSRVWPHWPSRPHRPCITLVFYSIGSIFVCAWFNFTRFRLSIGMHMEKKVFVCMPKHCVCHWKVIMSILFVMNYIEFRSNIHINSIENWKKMKIALY